MADIGHYMPRVCVANLPCRGVDNAGKAGHRRAEADDRLEGVKSMNVVVTGGSGFIGSHVVDALIDGGHQVTVIDHRVRPHRSDVNFEDVDLLDLSSVMVATRGADHIFHLGAVSNVNYAFRYPAYSTALNVMGTTNVLEAARRGGRRSRHRRSPRPGRRRP